MALTADEAGTEKVPPAVELVLRQVRFVPALDKGLPVDGRLKFNLASLVN